jgi:upstream activation factor subunit UAF30
MTGALSFDDARATVRFVGYVGKKKKKVAAKAVTPSHTLAAVVGSSSMPRSEVTKRIWGYIKRNGLLDTKKSRVVVHADKKLKPVFAGKSDVSMFEMSKLVSRHLKK